MTRLKKVMDAAAKLHTHVVVFRAGSDEDIAARLALCGLSTAAIMEETGLSESQVIYRLNKARIKRRAYRDATGDFAKRLLRIGTRMAAEEVRTQIAPKWLPRAASRLNQ